MADEPKKEEPKALAPRDTTPVGILMEAVSFKRIQIERVLPKWMTVERFLTQVRWALSNSKAAAKLVLCTPASVVNSVLTAADLGLDPSGRLGSAYLVPYGSECQLIPGYRGLIDLAARSGFIRSVNAWAVREKDYFKPVNGRMPQHVPYLPKAGEDTDPGPAYAFWARYNTRGGGAESEIMSLREVWAIRDKSAGYRAAVQYKDNTAPWIAYFDEQAKKTVIRRLLKKAPLNPTGGLNVELERFAAALEHDEKMEAHEDATVMDEPPAESKTERIKKDL